MREAPLLQVTAKTQNCATVLTAIQSTSIHEVAYPAPQYEFLFLPGRP